MSKWTKNSESAVNFTIFIISKKKLTDLKKGFFGKSQKSSILTKNGQKMTFHLIT